MSTPIEPVVQLFDVDTAVEYKDGTLIDFGEVKAGDKSDVKTIRLWNNKGGSQVASTMRDVELFILDGNDAKNEPIVKEGWLHTKCLTGDNVEVRLNDTNSLAVTGGGQNEGEILGAINDGDPLNAEGNFADLEIFIKIVENVLNATHGEKPFSLAFRYFFT